MSIFAIGDLHLSFGSKKPMDIFLGWEDYTTKIEKNWNNIVKPNDTVVLCGDVSWAMNLDELKPDFEFIEKLNGKKILIKGNHDYWWTTIKKLNNFVEENKFKTISFLHNNAYKVENVWICGTRGWVVENKKFKVFDEKISQREANRLLLSFNFANDDSERICFLHYPPVFDIFCSEEILKIIKEYNISSCYYGHIHGSGSRYSVFGEYNGCNYTLVSSDIVNFTPIKINTKKTK